MTSTLYLRGHWPTARDKRLDYKRLVGILWDAGWQEQPREQLVIATAVFRAESGFDPVAYLAYLQVPGAPGEPRRYPWKHDLHWLLDDDGNLEPGNPPNPSAWQRKVFWKSVDWLRAQPTNITLGRLPAFLAARPLASTLPHRRITLPNTTEGRPRVDYGLGQLNSQYHPILSDPYENAIYCYQHVYLGRSKTFTAWVAYTGGSYMKFMADARDAVSRMLG